MIKNLLFIFTLLFAIHLNAENHALNLSPIEKQYLIDHPTITAHNEENWPPFNFNEDGVARGYSIDYMNLLLSKIGIKVKFISGYSWAEYIEMLQTSKLDLIVNISKNKKRSETIEFTDVFLSVNNAIYVNRNKQLFYNLETLKGYTIAMPKGFYAQEFIEENYPDIKQVLVKNQLNALKLLEEGKVHATIGKKVVMDYIMQKEYIQNINSTRYIDDKRLISHIRIGASKKDSILINILKKAQQLVTKEEKELLNFKWLGMTDNNNNNKLELSVKEKKYLVNKKELQLCVNSNKMPLEKIENNLHKGLSSEYINILKNNINIPIKIIQTSSSTDTIMKLKNQKCDIASILPLQNKHKKEINYIYPYINTKILVASKINNVYIHNLYIYLDKTFLISDNDLIYNVIKEKYPNIKLKKVDSVNVALNMVEKGEAFAFLGDSLTLTYSIQTKFLGTIGIVGKLDKYITYSIATRNGDNMLNEIIKKVTASISLSDKLKIESKWLQFTNNSIKDNLLIIKLLATFFVIILCFLFIYKKQKLLKNKIEKLNQKLETKVKQKDETIFKQAKLISMGEMISNISHQWRQPLSEVNSIVMNLEKDFYSNQMNEKSLEKNLAKIEKLTEYMSNTIDNFNNFFKSNKEKRNLLISENLNKVLNLFENTFQKENICIETNIHKDNHINIYEGELLQVLIILLQNSKDAFISNNIQRRVINIDINIKNNELLLTIKDNAGGIRDDIIEKIFQPYFTTKPETHGIGLGLYLSKQIIEKSMKGKLIVSSKNTTTIFTIILPFD